MSAEGMRMQAMHNALMRKPRRTASDRNKRFLCPAGCGARTTKNQLKLHAQCHACKAPMQLQRACT